MQLSVTEGENDLVDQLNLADAFVIFFTLIGPQKVLLNVARMARDRDVRSLRLAMAYAALAGACVGVACTLTAPWVASFFHITTASVEIAAGMVFFIYATGLVFGFHFGENTHPASESGGTDADGTGDHDEDAGDDPDIRHPARSGFRELLMPLVVSPLGVAAALEESLTAGTWGARGIVAGAYAAVVAVNLIIVVAFAPLMRRFHATSLEVLSRLLGIMLCAVGVNLILQGLAYLGVHLDSGH
jgi:multiple antibiotic resistance protein